MTASPCNRCGTPHQLAGGLCSPCKAARNQARNADRPRYASASRGPEHQRRARQLRKDSEAAGAPCHICGRPIDYSLKAPSPWAFNADHLTPDPAGPLGASHAYCNNARRRPK